MTDQDLKIEVQQIRDALGERLAKAREAAQRCADGLAEAQAEFSMKRLEELEKSGFLRSEQRHKLLASIEQAKDALTKSFDQVLQVESEHREYFQPL